MGEQQSIVWLGHHGGKIDLALLLAEGDRFAVDCVESFEVLVEPGDGQQLKHEVFGQAAADLRPCLL
jgi:hypothetical protein